MKLKEEVLFLCLSCLCPPPSCCPLPSSSWPKDLLPRCCLLFSSVLELPSPPSSPLAGFLPYSRPCELLDQRAWIFPGTHPSLFDRLFLALLVSHSLAPHVWEGPHVLAPPSSKGRAVCPPLSLVARAVFLRLSCLPALVVFCLHLSEEPRLFYYRPFLAARSSCLHPSSKVLDALHLPFEEVLVFFPLPSSSPPPFWPDLLSSSPRPLAFLAAAPGHGLPEGVVESARGPVASRLQELSVKREIEGFVLFPNPNQTTTFCMDSYL